MDPYRVKLVSFLKMHSNIEKAPPVSTGVSTEEFQQGWIIAWEFTSSGTSGFMLVRVLGCGTRTRKVACVAEELFTGCATGLVTDLL